MTLPSPFLSFYLEKYQLLPLQVITLTSLLQEANTLFFFFIFFFLFYSKTLCFPHTIPRATLFGSWNLKHKTPRSWRTTKIPPFCVVKFGAIPPWMSFSLKKWCLGAKSISLRSLLVVGKSSFLLWQSA